MGISPLPAPRRLALIGFATSVAERLATSAESLDAVVEAFRGLPEVGFVGRLRGFDLILVHASAEPVSAVEIAETVGHLIGDVTVVIVRDDATAMQVIGELRGRAEPGVG